MNTRVGSRKPDLSLVDPCEGVGLQDRQAPAASEDSDRDEVDWRARVAGYADSMQAFDPAIFRLDDDEADGQNAALAAGALIVASTILIDELFEDITTMAPLGQADRAGLDGLLALGELPPQFAGRYDGRFARKFLVAAVLIIGRFSAPRWEPPSSLAEALALHIVVRRAQALLVDHECLDEQQARDLYAGFEDAAFQDVDHEWLYQATRIIGRQGARAATSPDVVLLSWFEPYPGTRAHPFLAESWVERGAGRADSAHRLPRARPSRDSGSAGLVTVEESPFELPRSAARMELVSETN